MQESFVGHQREAALDGRAGRCRIARGERDLRVGQDGLGIVRQHGVRLRPQRGGLGQPSRIRDLARSRLQRLVARFERRATRGVASANDPLVTAQDRIRVRRVVVPDSGGGQAQPVDGERLAHVQEGRVRGHLQPEVPVVEPVEREVVAHPVVPHERHVEQAAVGRKEVAAQEHQFGVLERVGTMEVRLPGVDADVAVGDALAGMRVESAAEALDVGGHQEIVVVEDGGPAALHVIETEIAGARPEHRLARRHDAHRHVAGGRDVHAAARRIDDQPLDRPVGLRRDARRRVGEAGPAERAREDRDELAHGAVPLPSTRVTRRRTRARPCGSFPRCRRRRAPPTRIPPRTRKARSRRRRRASRGRSG